MYHSKVMILCWATIYLFALAATMIKGRWKALRPILTGAAIVAAGIGASALLENALGALLLSVALMVATYFTLKGFIEIFGKQGS